MWCVSACLGYLIYQNHPSFNVPCSGKRNEEEGRRDVEAALETIWYVWSASRYNTHAGTSKQADTENDMEM